MKLSDIGEAGVIGKVAMLTTALPEGCVGIGDDCAVIRKSDIDSFLVTTDALVEGTHFLKDKITSDQLGYKSLMVNISDIAAMGGEPKFAFLSIALPKDLDEAWVNGFLSGIKRGCEAFGVTLLGGDTTSSVTGIFINITLIGEAKTQSIKYRHTARVGDVVAITRAVGASAAGCQMLLDGEVDHPFISKHLSPKPEVRKGQWFAKREDVSSMMDVSDGLYQDLRTLCKSSEVGGEIVLENIPLPENFDDYDTDFAVTSGEEYCLLITVNKESFPRLARDYKDAFGQELYLVGRITDTKGVHCLRDGEVVTLPTEGFNHFK